MRLRIAGPGCAGTGRGPRLRRDRLRIGALLAVVCLLAPNLALNGPAQTALPAQRDYAALKSEMARFAGLLADTLPKMFEGRPLVVLEAPKSAYLEGYGVVTHAEVNIFPLSSFSLFMSQQALEEQMKQEREQKPLRLKELRSRLMQLLLEEAASTNALPAGENLAIIVHLFNARPQADIPNQVVVQARREALLELRAGGRQPAAQALARAISVREF